MCTQSVRRSLLIPLAIALLFMSVKAEDVPAGQRIFYSGHSFHMFIVAKVEQMATAAGIQGHRTAGQQMIGGSKVIQHWELADEKNGAKKALAGGQVDVMTMAPNIQMPDAGIDNFVELGLKNNLNMRFFVQDSWVPYDTQPDHVKDNAQRDTIELDVLQANNDKWRGQIEAQVDTLNTKNGKKSVFIVPVGDAVMALRKRIKAGEFPGIEKPSQLFRDPIGHGQGQIMILTAYCNFAAIYKKSPVGLKITERGVSDDQNAILQKIAWDTVSNYDRAGVKK